MLLASFTLFLYSFVFLPAWSFPILRNILFHYPSIGKNCESAVRRQPESNQPFPFWFRRNLRSKKNIKLQNTKYLRVCHLIFFRLFDPYNLIHWRIRLLFLCLFHLELALLVIYFTRSFQVRLKKLMRIVLTILQNFKNIEWNETRVIVLDHTISFIKA